MIRKARKNQTKDRNIKNKRGSWGPLGPLGSPPSLVLDLSIFWFIFLDFLIILFDFVDFLIDAHGLGDVRERVRAGSGSSRFWFRPVPVQQVHFLRPVRPVRFKNGSVSGSRVGSRASCRMEVVACECRHRI